MLLNLVETSNVYLAFVYFVWAGSDMNFHDFLRYKLRQDSLIVWLQVINTMWLVRAGSGMYMVVSGCQIWSWPIHSVRQDLGFKNEQETDWKITWILLPWYNTGTLDGNRIRNGRPTIRILVTWYSAGNLAEIHEGNGDRIQRFISDTGIGRNQWELAAGSEHGILLPRNHGKFTGTGRFLPCVFDLGRF